MTGVRRLALPLLLVLALAGPVSPTTAAPATAGPARSSSSPPLGVHTSLLRASLSCSTDLATSTRKPVLLVPGTTLDAATNYDWNYEPALSARHIPWCAVTVPEHGMGDIQVAAEYVVHAIRTMHARTGHRIRIIGFSQGGMSPRWALKYWPGTRAMVSDYIGIDPSNHGTLTAVPLCTTACAPAFHQQATGSHFLTALNTGPETFAGIDYTVVYTLTDEVVTPNVGPHASSALHGGKGDIADITAQSICPAHVADHLSMGSIDPVGWAVALDALTHAGPARASQIPAAVCTQALMPGVVAADLVTNEARYTAQVATSIATSPTTTSEPPLKAYAR